MQDCSNSIAKALELLHSCTKLSISLIIFPCSIANRQVITATDTYHDLVSGELSWTRGVRVTAPLRPRFQAKKYMLYRSPSLQLIAIPLYMIYSNKLEVRCLTWNMFSTPNGHHLFHQWLSIYDMLWSLRSDWEAISTDLVPTRPCEVLRYHAVMKWPVISFHTLLIWEM